MKDNEAIYSDTPSAALIQLQSKQLDLESGILGKIFGGFKNAPSNIAGMCLFLLLAVGIVVLFVQNLNMTATEYWKYSTSIITLILGYLFGRGSS
ncbi:MAG TPA: hypothetical protein PLQ34_03115 [Ferrovaceae bacterium]|jgi:hypothetical protein|nr:hypothetical protein [Ferrovaceae bacterium]